MADESNDQPRELRRGRYPKAFRKDAAALVIAQRRVAAEVARELGVNEQTLGQLGATGEDRPRHARGDLE
jgi:transposase-like protein